MSIVLPDVSYDISFYGSTLWHVDPGQWRCSEEGVGGEGGGIFA